MTNKHLQPKKALRAALFVLLLSLVGMTKGYAYDFSAVCSTGQTLYYNITDEENHYVELTCPGTTGYYSWTGFTKPFGDIVLPESVQFDGVAYIVISIGNHAFYNCNGLTGSLTIPNSVISIDQSAFYNCSGLTGNLTISNSVSTIGSYAFRNCSGLTGDLNIPNSVTSISEYAFDGCVGLTGSLFIPNSVTNIGNYNVFPTRFEQIVVSSGNTVFDSRNGCNALINSSTNQLVLGCKNTIIPNSVTSIGSSAFRDCIGLTSITIPNSVNSISNGAFMYCIGIELMVVESGNTVYDSRENCNAIIKTSTNSLIAGCKNTIIPNSVDRIDSFAFYGCTSLTSIEIPNSVTWICNQAFYGCTSLTSIEIPSSVTLLLN